MDALKAEAGRSPLLMMAEELLRRTSRMMSIRWKDAAEVLEEELMTLVLHG